MGDYIERETSGEYFNPVSGTVEINPDPPTYFVTNSDENLMRWKWLTAKWNEMTFKERMAIFFPYVHHLNMRDITRPDFDEMLNAEIIDVAYKTCREFMQLQYDPDRQGIPNLMIIYKPINIDNIPNDDIKNRVQAWGRKYGFLKCRSNCTDCYWQND